MTASIIIAPALGWSGALRRQLTADPALGDWLADTATRPLTRHLIPAWLAELRQSPSDAPMTPDEVRVVLRRLRARVFYTAMVRDVNQVAPLQEVVAAMSALADVAVAEAYRSVAASLAEVHGTPLDPATGRPQELLILGMGKLGGRELNVSSDIDLVMLYGEEGETQGRRRLSHHEFYGRVTQRMMPVLSEIDAHGQVFRTDLRLRPDGDAGPLAWSLDALEHYLVAQGREWERYAWLKARALPCRAWADSDPSAQWQQLESLRRPFVYRKYFDFDALAALRALRERIREDWNRRALARRGVDAVHNVKLGDGGIREIEFVVQLNQLVRGGRLPSLQQRGLLPALHRQRRAGVLGAELADALESAYVFLRQVEHRLQYREDEQTHLLPADDAQRARLAETLGLDLAGFDARLAEHRAVVHQAFRDAFRLAGMGDGGDAKRQGGLRPDAAGGDEDASGVDASGADTSGVDTSDEASEGDAWPMLDDPGGLLGQRLQALQSSHRLRSLSNTSRQRVETLLPAALRAAAATAHPQQTAVRLLDLIEHIAQRSAYLALLAEYPEILARVARLVGASAWASGFLCRYPLLLDGLIEWHSLLAPPDVDAILRQLQAELDASLLPDGRPDVEQQMNLMRDLQHQVTFQLLAQDLAGVLSVEQLADQLSALADLLLGEALRRIWPMVRSDPAQAQPRFAIIAYGKLGGKELGYASDLDLVFLYDDPDAQASEDYLRLSRRLVSWLSTMTSSGRLYDIDLRLRPDGDAGLLAVPIEAFATYQRSNAWAWEHQAISRARYVAGDAAIGERFEAIRREVLLLPRDTDKLKAEVRDMRAKISAGHPNRSGQFDLKHDRGGMVDVEFVTQYLVLTQAARHPALLANLGNIALLGLAAQAGLLPPDLAARAADAYRVLRRHQHALRLEGAEKARLPQEALQDERTAVVQLWTHVIG